MRVLRIFLSLFLIATCFGQSSNVNLKPLPGMQFVNRTHRLGRGLVAYWPFNERSGTTAFDLSGNNHPGTLNGATFWTPGQTGLALDCDGSEDYIKIDSSPSLDITGDITIIVKFYPHSFGGNDFPGIVAKRTAFVGLNWQLYYNRTDSKLLFADGTNTAFAALNEDPSLNTWHTYAVTKKGTVGSLYHQGILLGTDTLVASFNTGDDIYIGALGGDILTYGLDGLFEYVMIYNRALSAGEIAEFYKEKDSWMFQRGDIELMAKSVEAPPAPGGQFIMIQMSMIPLFLIFTLVCFIRGKEIGK